MPDRRGNNRLDSLRNIVADPRVALLFLLPGIGETLRVNGRATLSTEPALLRRFVMDGKAPVCVLRIAVETVFFQCARAIKRAQLWDPAQHVARRLQAVGHDAVVAHVAAEHLAQAAQSEAVRVVDAARRQRLARHHQLVAGEEQAELDLPVHRERLDADRSGEARVLRQQAVAGGEDLAIARPLNHDRGAVAPLGGEALERQADLQGFARPAP